VEGQRRQLNWNYGIANNCARERVAVSMTVKALTFDIIGTVFDWLGSFSAKVAPLAQKYGLSIDPVAFANGAEQGYASGVQAVLAGGAWVPPARSCATRSLRCSQRRAPTHRRRTRSMTSLRSGARSIRGRMRHSRFMHCTTASPRRSCPT
jgi:hypothetical protein